MLQYSFWINNKGKRARWIFPLALYILVRLSSGILESNKNTQNIGGIIVGLYLIFVLTTWLINPLANFFLLFHKDGKYAVTVTERYTAITVVATLISGVTLLLSSFLIKNEKLSVNVLITGIIFFILAIPLGNIQYPLSFNAYNAKNKTAIILTLLALVTAALVFIYLPAAMVTGAIFLIIFVLNNWIGIFK